MLYNGPWMIGNHVYVQLSKAHVLGRTVFSRHVLKAHTVLVACYQKLQIEVSYTQQPLITIIHNHEIFSVLNV